MKKLLFLSVLIMAAILPAVAQSSLVATLIHNGETVAYYGSTAFTGAYKAAAEGDIITLSAGTFTCPQIQKNITIRGAGFKNHKEGKATVLQASTINVPTSESAQFTLEGVLCKPSGTSTDITGTGLNFLKCKFAGDIYYYGKDCNFVSCDVSYLYCQAATTSYWQNSIIRQSQLAAGTQYTNYSLQVEMVNCVVLNTVASTMTSSRYYLSLFTNSIFTNCIFYSANTSDYIDAGCTVNNCLGICSSNLFKNMPNSNNYSTTSLENVFTDYPSAGADATMTLRPSAAAEYLGTDGMQVGLYGGVVPYDPTTTAPQISRVKVNPKSTTDGRLDIEIEVTNVK